MTNPIYSLFILLIDLATRLRSGRGQKEKRFVTGRKGLFETLTKDLAENRDPLAWFHCASVGEFEQGIPLIEAFKRSHGDFKILVTFFSPSAEQAISESEYVDFAYFLPLDYPSNARRFIKIVKPQMVFFIKYEFWGNYLRETSKQNIPLILASAIFRQSQPFFSWYGGFHRNMLRRFNHIFVQDRNSAELLTSLNLRSTVTGDTRFDRVIGLKNINKRYPRIEALVNGKKVMVVGSMRDEDEDLIKEFISKHTELLFIVAPHEIDEGKIISFQKSTNALRYSQLEDQPMPNKRVLIIDNIGMLSQIYKYGNYAYVGGGFSDGLHNLLEPAVNEIPVFFGNQQYSKFKEAIDMIEMGAGFPIGNVKEMSKVFSDLDANSAEYRRLQGKLSSYVNDNQGAATKILAEVERQ